MNSNQQDFDQMLEHMLRQANIEEDALTGDEKRELATVAELLATTDLSSRSLIRQSLRTQLLDSTQQAQGTTSMKTRKLKIALVTCVAIFILSLAIPSVRAFAQSWFAKVGFMTITNEDEKLFPTQAFDPAAPTSSPIPANMMEQLPTTLSEEGPYTNMSAEYAAQLAGFDHVREPGMVPNGYTFGGRTATGWSEQVTVSTIYHLADDPVFGFVTISQSKGTAEVTFKVGSRAISSEIRIADFDATFIENADLSESNGRLFNLLLWEEGEYTYMLATPSLSQQELIALAESMYP